MHQNRLGDFLGTILDAARFHPYRDRLRFPRLRLWYWQHFRPAKWRRLDTINLGCGPRIYPGMINIDAVRPSDLRFNFLNPFPLPDGIAARIYCEHVLEHFLVQHVPHILSEVHRILRPQGVIRISVPTIDMSNPDRARLNQLLFHHEHKCTYTAEFLQALLKDAGFRETAVLTEGETRWLTPEFVAQVEHRKQGNLIVEARK